MNPSVKQYLLISEQMLWLKARGQCTEQDEDRFIDALDDLWWKMGYDGQEIVEAANTQKIYGVYDDYPGTPWIKLRPHCNVYWCETYQTPGYTKISPTLLILDGDSLRGILDQHELVYEITERLPGGIAILKTPDLDQLFADTGKVLAPENMRYD